MNMLNIVGEIEDLHFKSILKWKKDGVLLSHSELLGLVEENHAFNYRLWHAEDRARRDDMGHEYVYKAKREIDFCNQQRNNKMEVIDEFFYKDLNPAAVGSCPTNSETPGMMIDRMSILALKLYHMREQANRQDVDDSHRQKCLQKTNTIILQKDQLGSCLSELIQEVKNKTRTFRVYHQFKMYNDPELNPELY
ncbi:MAG: DUF4254 domain-containing protein [Legionellaceae bacterium]|nr:DUF4254 domain-containing protein [Legionellaceae bacterium]